MARALLLLLVLSSGFALARSDPVPVSVSVGSRYAHVVPPTYASFNLDYHYDSEEWPVWKGCSVINMSLTEPNLVFLAKALAPAVLRVGGSEGDMVVYETPTSPCPPDPNATLFCLTMSRWIEINDFAQQTGNLVAFGLNALAGRNKTCHTCPWDPTNAAAFLAYSASIGIQPFAYEFGNELTPFIAVETYAADVLVLRGLIDSTYPNVATRPKLVTNDANPDPSYLMKLLSGAKGAIDVATWHLYIGYGLDPLLDTYAWSPSFLDKINTTANSILAAVAAADFKGEVWVGESAFAWHSGRAGVTNTFLSSPWWMTALGQLSGTHSGFCRQTLMGGSYELIDKITRSPNADWWVARLWKDSMGSAVFEASSNTSDVRVFAHCAPTGGLSVAFINFSSNTTAALTLAQAVQPATSPIALRILSSADNVTVALNSKVLVYTPGSGALPSLLPATATGGAPIMLPPHTLGFVTFPDAHAYDC